MRDTLSPTETRVLHAINRGERENGIGLRAADVYRIADDAPAAAAFLTFTPDPDKSKLLEIVAVAEGRIVPGSVDAIVSNNGPDAELWYRLNDRGRRMVAQMKHNMSAYSSLKRRTRKNARRS